MTAAAMDKTAAQTLTRAQKLAVLLLMLGPESAAQILKNLDETELEHVVREMAGLNNIGHEAQAEVLKEFSQVAVQASTTLSGGADVARATLEKAIGQGRAASLVSRVAAEKSQSAALQPLWHASAAELYNLVKTEQPQTLALILSHLPPEKATEFLNQCPPELRDKVVERLATLAPTPIEVIETIAAVLAPKLGVKPTRAITTTGGLKSAAALLNTLERSVSKTVLSSIEERDPDLSTSIRKKMFTFEDMLRLDNAALQKVMREVDTRDLAISLKKAGDALQGALLGAISKRAAETVKEEITFLGSIKAKEIEAAQTRIVDIVRRLEGEGEIELNPQEEKSDVAA
jgi:flagellar motor switch protein FliG